MTDAELLIAFMTHLIPVFIAFWFGQMHERNKSKEVDPAKLSGEEQSLLSKLLKK
jgi:hypothetical protein